MNDPLIVAFKVLVVFVERMCDGVMVSKCSSLWRAAFEMAFLVVLL